MLPPHNTTHTFNQEQILCQIMLVSEILIFMCNRCAENQIPIKPASFCHGLLKALIHILLQSGDVTPPPVAGLYRP